jgi:hypothetical protein
MSTATQDLVSETLNPFQGTVAEGPGAETPSEDSVVDLMQDAYAPVALFAVGRVEWVEEVAFRALFLVAALVAAYGVMVAW